jgi:hypothetical protein
MTEKPRTFEDWKSEHLHLIDFADQRDYTTALTLTEAAWKERDPEVAAKDRRIEEFASEIIGLIKRHAIEQVALQAQIDRVRDILKEFKNGPELSIPYRTARELLAALGEPATAKIVHAGPLKMKPIDEGEPAATSATFDTEWGGDNGPAAAPGREP